MTITINVTQEDINQSSCPISHAVKRICTGYQNVWLGNNYIFFDVNHNDCDHAWIPAEAQQFRKLFDNGKAVNPFSFSIKLHTY